MIAVKAESECMFTYMLKKLSFVACICILLCTQSFAIPIPTINPNRIDIEFENALGKTKINCDIITSSKNDELINIWAYAYEEQGFSNITSTLNGQDIGYMPNRVNVLIKGNNFTNKLEIVFRLNNTRKRYMYLQFRKYSDVPIDVNSCTSTPIADDTSVIKPQ